MEWFRWYHGTTSDPKFSIVSKRAKQPRYVVIACWPVILEYASSRDDRGTVTGLDLEEVSVVLDLELEQVQAVYQAMIDKGMIVSDRLKSWSKRQPKRENDNTAAERIARWRDKKKVESNSVDSDGNAPVTHGNAPVTHATDKNRTEQSITEQSREEHTTPTPNKVAVSDFHFIHFEQFGTQMPRGANNVAIELCQRFSKEEIIKAFEVASCAGKCSVAYVKGVLLGNGNGKSGKKLEYNHDEIFGKDD